jgi:tetratricopeptide (TPR) repeat protein
MLNPIRRLLSVPNPRKSFCRLVDRADAANAAKQWLQAETDYAAALRIDPAQAPIWVQYGHVLKEQGHAARAEQAYRKAIEDDGRANETHLHLGHLLLSQNRREEAIAAFRRSHVLDPASPHSRAALEALGAAPEAGEGTEGDDKLFDLDDLAPLQPRDPAVSPTAETPRDRFRVAVIPHLRRLSVRRPPAAVAFIHLQKTGGTTLYDILQHAFPPDRVCPIHNDFLNLYTAEEMAEFDYFSGHFDYGSLRLIPKRPLKVISVFRRPQDRLISIYRSHRSHEANSKYGVNAFVRLANALSPEEFFEHPEVRTAPEVFNHYLAAFGLGFRQLAKAGPLTPTRVPAEAVERAIERVRGLDAIGITERFDTTVRLIYQTLGLRPPKAVRPRNVTDKVAKKMKGVPTQRVGLTPRLVEAMADLIRFDEQIYAAAVAEAERRLREAR